MRRVKTNLETNGRVARSPQGEKLGVLGAAALGAATCTFGQSCFRNTACPTCWPEALNSL